MKLPHGHIWTFPEVDQFIDRALAKKEFPEIAALRAKRGTVRTKATEPLDSATLNYTSDTGPWQTREWTTVPAKISGKSIEAKLPDATPITYFIAGQTKDGFRISSEYAEVR